MSQVRQLHNKAMEYAQLAIVARHNQDLSKADSLAKEAYQFELQAAELIPEKKSSEPTRSILYRSAASLAYQYKDYEEAQRLIAKALSGYPPKNIQKELSALLSQISFEKKIESNNLSLADDDFELSFKGNNVGYGVMFYDDFAEKIKTIKNLIDRVIQRLMSAPFQKTGRISKNYRPFNTVLSTSKAGSYAINIKLATPKSEQQSLFINAEKVIDELITCLELVNNKDEPTLKKRISNTSYYQNFISLTKNLVPDGEKINFVSLISSKKSVNLTILRDQIQFTADIEKIKQDVESEPIKVKGILDYATARKKESIGLTTDNGSQYSIIVQEGLDDVVRSYFKQYVEVAGIFDNKYIHLTDIKLIDE